MSTAAAAGGGMAGNNVASSIKVRLVIQQCLNASLKLPNDDLLQLKSEGQIVFLCFMKDATEDDVIKAAKAVFNVKLSENEPNAKRVSIENLENSEILVVPQATLGGKYKKGKNIQYHGNIEKELGAKYYELFIATLKSEFRKGEGIILSGQYGARQVLSMETNGPYTHILDF